MKTCPVSPAPARTGAKSIAEIAPDLLQQLNHGTLEAVTLAEVLAIDHGQLLRAIAPDLGTPILEQVSAHGHLKIKARMQIVGQLLLDRYGLTGSERFATHRSDTARSWAAMMVGLAPGLSFPDRLAQIANLADDPNANVREWAWMALRPHVAHQLELAIAQLIPWTLHPSPNLRRFATELTRPRGVWCAHIQALKREPSLGLPLLEPLRADPARYVQNSVANWLNDAAKSQPQFVWDCCQRWQRESTTRATAYICRRALRGLLDRGGQDDRTLADRAS
jgi:3-methyladenine DNA glycosylase AlkC